MRSRREARASRNSLSDERHTDGKLLAGSGRIEIKLIEEIINNENEQKNNCTFINFYAYSFFCFDSVCSGR